MRYSQYEVVTNVTREQSKENRKLHSWLFTKVHNVGMAHSFSLLQGFWFKRGKRVLLQTS